MTTVLSWSEPKADWPFPLRTPMTSQDKPPRRRRRPSGSAWPNSTVLTVCPITQTELAERMSPSVKGRPLSKVQSCTTKKSDSVPVTVVS
jgi:hypothetical protein